MNEIVQGTMQGTPWVEERSGDLLEGVWVPTGARAAARIPELGRILQAEEGGTLARTLSAAIAGAHEVVLVSSFLFADAGIERALLDAAKRGVRIYLLVASEARLDKEIRAEDAFGQKTLEDHKRLLDRLAGWVYVRSAEHFHAKFVIIDPKSRPSGILLTANLTKEALTRNHELALRLRPEEVRALAGLFTWAFWESAQRELLSAGSLPPVTAEGRISLPAPRDGVVATAGGKRYLREAVLRTIQAAERSLLVATFGIADSEVIEALSDRARRGVAVTLLVRHPRHALFETLRGLARAGVEVLGAGEYLHAKAVAADGTRGLVMTANMEEHGLDRGFEVGVELTGSDAAALAGVLGAWRAAAPWRLKASARVGELRGVVQVLNGKGYKDLVVEPAGRAEYGPVKVDCCTKIASAEPPAPGRTPDGKLYHRIEHIWSIAPPLLKSNAKPVTLPKDEASPPPFPVYEEPGGRRVFAIDRLDSLDGARAAMTAFGVGAVVLRR